MTRFSLTSANIAASWVRSLKWLCPGVTSIPKTLLLLPEESLTIAGPQCIIEPSELVALSSRKLKPAPMFFTVPSPRTVFRI